MLIVLLTLGWFLGCSSSPEKGPATASSEVEAADAPVLPKAKRLVRDPKHDSQGPLTAQIAVLRIGHHKYSGYELFIDGEPRGPLPLDTTLTFGPHTFEILVGPADKVEFVKEVKRKAGWQLFDLASEEEPSAHP